LFFRATLNSELSASFECNMFIVTYRIVSRRLIEIFVNHDSTEFNKKLRAALGRLFNGTPSQSYKVSLVTRDHTRVTCPPDTSEVDTPRLNPSQRPVLDLSKQEGWKAKLT